jgi:pantothenate kinase
MMVFACGDGWLFVGIESCVSVYKEGHSMDYIDFRLFMPRQKTLARSRQHSHLRPMPVCPPRGSRDLGVCVSDRRRFTPFRRAEISHTHIRCVGCDRSTVLRVSNSPRRTAKPSLPTEYRTDQEIQFSDIDAGNIIHNSWQVQSPFCLTYHMDYNYGLMASRARYVHALERQITPAKRVVIALAGPPGSGKSTAAQRVVDLLNQNQEEPWVQLLPMDGFHYSQQVLDTFPNKIEAYARRGADWTFDAAELLKFVRTLRESDTNSTEVINAPGFDHASKDPTLDAIAIGPRISLVILEGSWLLLDLEPWKEISSLVDDTWFIDVDPKLARTRIAQRHVQAGIERDMIHALARADTNDMINGARIQTLLIPPRFKIQSIESQPYSPSTMAPTSTAMGPDVRACQDARVTA